MTQQKKGPIDPSLTGPGESEYQPTIQNIIPKGLIVKKGRCNGCFFLFDLEELVLDPEYGLLCDGCRTVSLNMFPKEAQYAGATL